MEKVKTFESHILDAYKSGKPVKQIARENGVSICKIHKILASCGITDATPTSQKVMRLYEEGASIGTISREMHIGRKAVDKYLPYISGSPHRPWTEEEDKIVLSGNTPEGRTLGSANIRRHRLKKSPPVVKLVESPLRKKRLEENLTQKELSKISDVPLSTIRAFEQGTRDICISSIDILDRLSKALNCNYREILPKKS